MRWCENFWQKKVWCKRLPFSSSTPQAWKLSTLPTSQFWPYNFPSGWMAGWELHEVFSSLCLVMVVGDAYILIVQMLRFTSFIACWDLMIILKVMAGALANIPRSWACWDACVLGKCEIFLFGLDTYLMYVDIVWLRTVYASVPTGLYSNIIIVIAKRLIK